MPAGAVIDANDELMPTGTMYVVTIFNSNGLLVRGPEFWILSGTSPIDLSTITSVSIPDPGLGSPVLQNPSAPQTISGQSLTLSTSAALNVLGGGSLQGIFSGGPVATIVASPTGATEVANTATFTTTAPCSFVTGQVVNISGVGVAGYNSPQGQGSIVLTPGCSGGSTFTVSLGVSGLAASGGGTATGSPVFSNGITSNALLSTGGGQPTQIGIQPLNLANYCGIGTSLGVVQLLGSGANTQSYPCSYTSLWYGAPLGNPTGTNWSVGHRNDCLNLPGKDSYGCIGELSIAVAQGTNSGGENSQYEGASNTIGAYAVASQVTTAGNQGVVGSSFIGQSSFTGLGTHLVQANQNLLTTAKAPGWAKDYTTVYSPMNSYNVTGGSQNISTYIVTGSSQAGKGALIGELITDSINAGHATLHGAAIAAPTVGYWNAAATLAGFYQTSSPIFSTNTGMAPSYSDLPTYSFLAGETAVTSGISGKIGLFSTQVAGTACTITASPNGLSQTGYVVTVTTTAGCAPAVPGALFSISGAGVAGYNVNGVVSTGAGGTTFTFYNNANGPGATTATITNIAESGTTVTVTTSGVCTFSAGMTAHIWGVPIDAPLSNNGYNGWFTIVSGCSGGSTFTYTHTLSGLATKTSGNVETELVPSGGGTATFATRNVSTEFIDSGGQYHRQFCTTGATTCAGADVFAVTSAGVVTGLVFQNTAANPAQSGNYRTCSTCAIGWRNNANNGDVLLGKNTSDQLTFAGNVVPSALNATSASLGGSALLAGQCSSNTTTVTGATTAMVCLTDPTTYPGDGAFWDCTVTSANTVTTKVCAVVSLTPTASTYNIKVFTA